jgi:hypothetical protein
MVITTFKLKIIDLKKNYLFQKITLNFRKNFLIFIIVKFDKNNF